LMPSLLPAAQVCDATGDDSSSTDDYINNQLVSKSTFSKPFYCN
jgi:hypothetical protein